MNPEVSLSQLAMSNPLTSQPKPKPDDGDQAPWWRVPMVWVVIGGPLSVVVASLATAVIAWKHIDPIINDNRNGPTEVVAPIAAPSAVDPKAAMAPALQGRNHAATPTH